MKKIFLWFVAFSLLFTQIFADNTSEYLSIKKTSTKTQQEYANSFIKKYDKLISNKTLKEQNELNNKNIIVLDNFVNKNYSKTNLSKTELEVKNILLLFINELAERVWLAKEVNYEEFIIEWEKIKLLDDKYIWESSNVQLFYEKSEIDINWDKKEDKILMFTKNNGWTGTFFYVCAWINDTDVYKWTNCIFVGDRISPQTIDFKDWQILVNYAKRYPWEDFATKTSVWATKYIEYKDWILKEIEFTKLNKEDAEKLAKEKWWKTFDEEDISNKSINILDWEDQIWYVELAISWLKDDSVDGIKRIMFVHNVNGEWKTWAEISTQYKCKEWRGSTSYSTELCN